MKVEDNGKITKKAQQKQKPSPGKRFRRTADNLIFKGDYPKKGLQSPYKTFAIALQNICIYFKKVLQLLQESVAVSVRKT